LALSATGCEESRPLVVSGPSAQNGIVVQSLEVNETFTERCTVGGELRNESGAAQRVTLVFEAFNGDGLSIATAIATVEFVGPGQAATYEARFQNITDDGFLTDCDRIARVELHEVVL
jgi:hypothetical protein